MHKSVKKNMNIGFGIAAAGVMVASYFAAGQSQFPTVEPGPDTPNPGLADGEFTITNDETAQNRPIRALTLTVDNGYMVNIVVEYNDENRMSHNLNTPTVLQLRAEALEEQSAEDLDFVSGATGTSQQFAESLQAAIDQARG
ncbi:MAG: FMN-binding protein [Cellulomonadaceae bacterium]|jgi:major membrane immunogen (membrane-anchored lipoprotein)|nr:FMN-binding protein [Cellulomonadaceae bacterium]